MKHLSILLFLFGLISCQAPERNCTDFKTGTYAYEIKFNDEILKGTFTRFDTLQIEQYEGNKVDSSAINWINDCEFIAKKIHPESMKEEKPLLFKILTTDENSYVFEYSYVGQATNKYKGTATKIE